MQASMAAPHMRLVVRDYTLDRAQAKPETQVDPTGLISFARQAPDADSQPQVNPKARSKGFRNKHSSLQVRVDRTVSDYASVGALTGTPCSALPPAACIAWDL